MAGTDDVRERLAGIAEELADLAIDRLRTAPSDQDDPDGLRAALAEERRITRARRAVERAVEMLGPDGQSEPD
ncbi:MAG TPA: hypothetical protein VE990_13985 [Acidimicrobiales bacterium]|nr:hypothetical protein [Acidimicrobiales bacterium]